MKKVFILILFLTFLVHPFAFAHEYAHDGSVTVVLHTDPDDAAVAKSLTTLHFEIQDRNNKFSLDKCNCTVSILQNSKNIFESNLLKDNSASKSVFNSDIKFTFPEKGNYLVELKGLPKNPNDFMPFEVKYNLNIDKQNSADFTVKLFLSIFTFIGAVLIIYFVYRSYKLTIKKPTLK